MGVSFWKYESGSFGDWKG